MTTPWIIDAKDIDATSFTDVFSTTLLLRNQHVNQFLNPNNRSRFLVVAPKGYGKTLLLKGKRLAHQDGSVRTLPINALVERPVGTPHVMSARATETLVGDLNYWRIAWIISVAICCLKQSETKLETRDRELRTLLADPSLTHACDIFARILQLNRREYSRVYQALNTHVIPAFRAIREPMMLFIDNIDEYFQDFMSEFEGAFIKNVTAEAWNFAQAGLALAARELHGINTHVRIYASIRKEVVQLLTRSYPMAQQLRGSIVDLSYSDSDLAEIIRMNIRAEPDSNLVEAEAEDDLERFVGTEGLQLRNELTLEDERVERLWLRHTLRRPRDVVQIGQELSLLEPSARTPERLREIIREAGRLIALAYLAECRAHLTGFDEELLYGLIPSNVLTRHEVELISLQYDDAYVAKHGSPDPDLHVFCNLYRIGLLGYVRPEGEGRPSEQVFARPGEQPYGPVEILPDAERYLIHPILDDFIAQRNSAYLGNLNTYNIIERGRPWRRGRAVGFVLLGDVHGFSEIMQNPDLYPRFAGAFEEMVEESCRAIRHHKVESGDQVLLIDANPLRLFEAARRLNGALLGSVFGTDLRFGGEAGVFDLDPNAHTAFNPNSVALRTAARLLPFARPGSILVAERFLEEMEAGRWTTRGLRSLVPDDRGDIPHDGERFRLQNRTGTDAVTTRLLEVDLSLRPKG